MFATAVRCIQIWSKHDRLSNQDCRFRFSFRSNIQAFWIPIVISSSTYKPLISEAELKFFFFFFFFSESPEWLKSFCNRFSDWSGLSLDAEENKRLRMCIIQKTPSILDVRNYLFARQSQLLLNLNRPWEVSIRTIYYLIVQYVCYYFWKLIPWVFEFFCYIPSIIL